MPCVMCSNRTLCKMPWETGEKQGISVRQGVLFYLEGRTGVESCRISRDFTEEKKRKGQIF